LKYVHFLVFLPFLAASCSTPLVDTSADAAVTAGDDALADAADGADSANSGDVGDALDGVAASDAVTIPGAQSPVTLGSLTTFVAVAGAGLTNSNSAGVTVLNGDVGLGPTATCMSDGSPCNPPGNSPTINGTLYQNDAGGLAVKAKADLVTAYNEAMARPPGKVVADLSELTLTPGVYTSDSTMQIAVNGTLTLDAQGDANAVWIFQLGSALTVNQGGKVVMINKGKAANVFWAVGSSSTLDGSVSFKGNVLAQSSNSVGVGSVVEGRLLCTTGQITLLSNVITLPAP
jgi:hypothetical protein